MCDIRERGVKSVFELKNFGSSEREPLATFSVRRTQKISAKKELNAILIRSKSRLFINKSERSSRGQKEKDLEKMRGDNKGVYPVSAKRY